MLPPRRQARTWPTYRLELGHIGGNDLLSKGSGNLPNASVSGTILERSGGYGPVFPWMAFFFFLISFSFLSHPFYICNIWVLASEIGWGMYIGGRGKNQM